MQEEAFGNSDRNSSDFLGLNKKSKKKKSQPPGLIQQQQMTQMGQGQEGVLAGKATDQGSIGSMNQGVGSENIIKKRRNR